MKNILCISTFYKGAAFLEAMAALGNNVYLITSSTLKDSDWPWDSIKETFYLEPIAKDMFDLNHLELGIAGVMRRIHFDTIVTLDDFDVERGAYLREQFRVPGMGQTTGRYFRDKLAMRIHAKDNDITIPAFSTVFNDANLSKFCQTSEGPWVLKPRSEASATGIKKINSEEELWPIINSLGNERHKYLIEQFKPGDVFHLDALSVDGEMVFCEVSQYEEPPLKVSQGGIFSTHSLPEDDLKNDLREICRHILSTFNIKFGASHTELIRCHADGKIYFLETASRVGGAHIAEMVEAATNVNLWAEWAKVEHARLNNTPYTLPETKQEYAGIVLALSKMKRPHYQVFTEPEVYWEIPLDYHIGAIFNSPSLDTIKGLLSKYKQQIGEQFLVS